MLRSCLVALVTGALFAGAGCTTRGTTEQDGGGIDAPFVIEVDAAGDAHAGCAPGEIECGGTCTRVVGDSRNCGSCGNACPSGVTCALGRCDCMAPMLGCDGVCLDPSSDPMNCGECGNVCASGEMCSMGECILQCDAPSALCTQRATDGTTYQACVDVQTDSANCGACNTRCAGGASCVAGRCACPTGQTNCSGMCTDTATDVYNCGACLNSCGAGGTCAAGACSTCGTGLSACGTPSRCVDTMTNRLHCGSCGRACGGGEACVGGLCECSAGLIDCGSGCLNPMTDANNCGGCGISCGSGGVCSMGACTCATGLTMCGASCHDLDTDLAHCGACDDPCPALVGGVCAGGICGCPSGLTDCSGTCVNTTRDRAHCGTCGTACVEGETCRMGSCVVANSFRVTSFGTTSCNTLQHDPPSGDDHGGIAVSTTTLFVTGDSATVRVSAADLSGLAAVMGTPTVHNGLVGDLETEEVYVLLDAAGTEPNGTATITQLGVLDASTGQLTATRIPLTASIPVAYSSGVFSGYGEALIGVPGGSGLQWWHIELPTGVVTRLGNTQNPTHRGCETWAWWGVAERFGDVHYAAYVASSTQISRIAIPDTGSTTTAAVTVISTFTNLGDMCSITFSPSRNRWYFHHEYESQFSPTTTLGEILGSCAGTWDIP